MNATKRQNTTTVVPTARATAHTVPALGTPEHWHGRVGTRGARRPSREHQKALLVARGKRFFEALSGADALLDRADAPARRIHRDRAIQLWEEARHMTAPPPTPISAPTHHASAHPDAPLWWTVGAAMRTGDLFGNKSMLTAMKKSLQRSCALD